MHARPWHARPVRCGRRCSRARPIAAQAARLAISSANGPFALGFTLLGSALAAQSRPCASFSLICAGLSSSISPMAPMRGLGLRAGVIAAIKTDTLSPSPTNSACSPGWDLRARLDPAMEPTDWSYWLMMQIAMVIGFATTYPVNWLLIRRGNQGKDVAALGSTRCEAAQSQRDFGSKHEAPSFLWPRRLGRLSLRSPGARRLRLLRRLAQSRGRARRDFRSHAGRRLRRSRARPESARSPGAAARVQDAGLGLCRWPHWRRPGRRRQGGDGGAGARAGRRGGAIWRQPLHAGGDLGGGVEFRPEDGRAPARPVADHARLLRRTRQIISAPN